MWSSFALIGCESRKERREQLLDCGLLFCGWVGQVNDVSWGYVIPAIYHDQPSPPRNRPQWKQWENFRIYFWSNPHKALPNRLQASTATTRSWTHWKEVDFDSNKINNNFPNHFRFIVVVGWSIIIRGGRQTAEDYAGDRVVGLIVWLEVAFINLFAPPIWKHFIACDGRERQKSPSCTPSILPLLLLLRHQLVPCFTKRTFTFIVLEDLSSSGSAKAWPEPVAVNCTRMLFCRMPRWKKRLLPLLALS